jgi:hypothetical protein
MNDENQSLTKEFRRDQMVQIGNEDSPLVALARLAAGGATREVIEQMKALVEWDDARRARAEFNAAFSAAKQEFKKAQKSGFNTHLDSKYSTLEDYDEATRESLSKNGLSWRHVPASLEGDITSVKCILAHKGGHSEEAEMRAASFSMTNNAVNKLQSVGIVTMYLKRMTLSAMLGLVSTEEDNDGNGGTEQEKINDSQAADIKAMIQEVGADTKKFLQYISSAGKVRIRSVEEIPANMHEQACNELARKRKKKAEPK